MATDTMPIVQQREPALDAGSGLDVNRAAVTQLEYLHQCIDESMDRRGSTAKWYRRVNFGYQIAAAVLSRIAGEVQAIERHASLADSAQARLRALGYDNVAISTGDGSGGLPDKAPFEAILVAAGSDNVPDPLRRQLAVGGRLVVPVGGAGLQSLLCVTRTGEGSWTENDLGGVRFVPLIGAFGHGGRC